MRPLALALLAACATAPVARAPADPCRGTDLDYADALDACALPPGAWPPPSPPPGALTARVEPATVRSGATGATRVVFTNATAAPLDLELRAGCLELAAYVETPGGKPVSYLNDCELGALCAGGRHARVILAPGGVLRATVPVDAHVVRLAPAGAECKERVEGPVPPGRYRLTVELPFTDEKNVEREAVGEVTVTP